MYKYLLLILALGTLVSCSENNTQSNAVEHQSSIDSNSLEISSSVKYVEGVDYEIVENISLNETIIEPFIVEYFWFGCSHCQNLEPHINNFSVENKVKLIKKPAPLKERWVMDARVYYALSETDNMAMYDDLFKLYTQMTKQGKLLDTNEIVNFLKRKNIDIKAFNKAMNSDNVTAKIKQNLEEMIHNKLSGVPKLVINGKYLAKPTDKIKTNQDYMDLIKFLLTIK
ncbi:DsbA family protein [Colwellia sp. BRX10-3]|uniref:DsbA family protein n=1 Tax=Colwellia sp. BRX10-3 TaxID=2759844 RepID=UPI0015F611D1|nr:DsbA family protein [Colwellia sp. BRX10-3]MBA6392402.1 DsbA family protein [Colwellia sp. BRX10-3]